MIKSVRHIQINKISYTPNLFKAVFTYEPYSNKYDESDEIEHNKKKNLRYYYNINKTFEFKN